MKISRYYQIIFESVLVGVLADAGRGLCETGAKQSTNPQIKTAKNKRHLVQEGFARRGPWDN